MTTRRLLAAALGAAALLLGGCAHKSTPYDYTAFQKARPASLLVLPPVNDTNDIKATPGVWANATQPLAEAGYYVLPSTLVDSTFKQNGVTTARDAQELPTAKLHEVFGADAAVYIDVRQYGTTYAVIASETRVTANARIVDLRSGALLWQGTATASSNEENNGNSGGLAALLVTALVKQIVGSTSDAAFKYAAIADDRLLGAPRFNGILPGPRSPRNGQPVPQ